MSSRQLDRQLLGHLRTYPAHQKQFAVLRESLVKVVESGQFPSLEVADAGDRFLTIKLAGNEWVVRQQFDVGTGRSNLTAHAVSRFPEAEITYTSTGQVAAMDERGNLYINDWTGSVEDQHEARVLAFHLIALVPAA